MATITTTNGVTLVTEATAADSGFIPSYNPGSKYFCANGLEVTISKRTDAQSGYTASWTFEGESYSMDLTADVVLIGGAWDSVVASTSIIMNGGTVNNVYGGGVTANADVTGNTSVVINAGNLIHLNGAGGCGSVGGNVNLTVGTAEGGPTIASTIVGGGWFEGADVAGNVTITLNNGKQGNAGADGYPCEFIAGGGVFANVKGKVTVNVVNGQYDAIVTGGTMISGNVAEVEVNMTGGQVIQLNGSCADFSNKGNGSVGNVVINVSGGIVQDAVIGGSIYQGDVTGNVVINVSGGAINTYGGSEAIIAGSNFADKITGSTSVNIITTGKNPPVLNGLITKSDATTLNDAAVDMSVIYVDSNATTSNLAAGKVFGVNYFADVNQAAPVALGANKMVIAEGSDVTYTLNPSFFLNTAESPADAERPSWDYVVDAAQTYDVQVDGTLGAYQILLNNAETNVSKTGKLYATGETMRIMGGTFTVEGNRAAGAKAPAASDVFEGSWGAGTRPAGQTQVKAGYFQLQQKAAATFNNTVFFINAGYFQVDNSTAEFNNTYVYLGSGGSYAPISIVVANKADVVFKNNSGIYGDTAFQMNITIDETSSLTLSDSTLENATSITNNGALIISGASTVDVDKFSGSGWVYMKDASVGADTKLIGANVRFASGNNIVNGATINGGRFQVGTGTYQAPDNNVDTKNGVIVTVKNNAHIGGIDGGASPFGGWVGSEFYDAQADKDAAMTDARYTLNIEKSIAEFGYLHISHDGILNVTGNADELHSINATNYTFRAGQFNINGVATFAGNAQVMAFNTNVSCDNATATPGKLIVTDGAVFYAKHEDSGLAATFKVWNNGIVEVSEGATFNIGENGAVLNIDSADAKMNITNATLNAGKVINNGALVVSGNSTLNITDLNSEASAVIFDNAQLTNSSIGGNKAYINVKGTNTYDGNFNVFWTKVGYMDGETLQTGSLSFSKDSVVKGAVLQVAAGSSVVYGSADETFAKGFGISEVYVEEGGKLSLINVSAASSMPVLFANGEVVIDNADINGHDLIIGNSQGNASLVIKNSTAVFGGNAVNAAVVIGDGKGGALTLEGSDVTIRVVGHHNSWADTTSKVLLVGYGEGAAAINVTASSTLTIKNNVAINEYSTITVTADSLLTADSIDNNGSIIIDDTDITVGAELKKIIDLSQTSALANVSLVEGSANSLFFGADGDVYITSQNASTIYVDAAWQGTEVGAAVEGGYIYGLNAYSTYDAALAAAGNGAVINVGGTSLYDASNIFIGKDGSADEVTVNFVGGVQVTIGNDNFRVDEGSVANVIDGSKVTYASAPIRGTLNIGSAEGETGIVTGANFNLYGEEGKGSAVINVYAGSQLIAAPESSANYSYVGHKSNADRTGVLNVFGGSVNTQYMTVYATGTINVTGGSFTANKSLENNGTINMDVTSTLTVNSITGAGSINITIDTDVLTAASYVLIDSEAALDLAKINISIDGADAIALDKLFGSATDTFYAIKEDADAAYTLVLEQTENDLVVHSVSNKIYVSSTYSGNFGDCVGEGLFYGVNAFGTLAEISGKVSEAPCTIIYDYAADLAAGKAGMIVTVKNDETSLVSYTVNGEYHNFYSSRTHEITFDADSADQTVKFVFTSGDFSFTSSPVEGNVEEAIGSGVAEDVSVDEIAGDKVYTFSVTNEQGDFSCAISDVAGTGEIAIYDAAGNLVANRLFNRDANVVLEGLATGDYEVVFSGYGYNAEADFKANMTLTQYEIPACRKDDTLESVTGTTAVSSVAGKAGEPDGRGEVDTTDWIKLNGFTPGVQNALEFTVSGSPVSVSLYNGEEQLLANFYVYDNKEGNAVDYTRYFSAATDFVYARLSTTGEAEYSVAVVTLP